MASSVEQKYTCINCYHKSSSLFMKYSDNGIRLTSCPNCGKPVDAYIEYDIVLIIIDLMLQYTKAYRHLLLNTNNPYCHKLCIVFVLCDAYTKWIRQRIKSGSENVYDLEWKFYECLLRSTLEMTSFMVVLVILLLPHISTKLAVSKILQAFCVGFYGNVFAVLSVIWHLHHHWSYRVLTELFILISHVQTQRALHNVTLTQSVFVVLLAAAISRFIGFFIDSFCFV